LSVFDVGGRLIKDLVDEDAGPGTFTREWDGTNANGEQVSTGVYFYRLNAGSFAETRKMVLIK
jgi:flagellar hook assembly protein FlgD